MGYKAGEEQYGCGGGHIGRVCARPGEIKEIPAMIYSHNEHNSPAQNVDRKYALF